MISNFAAESVTSQNYRFPIYSANRPFSERVSSRTCVPSQVSHWGGCERISSRGHPLFPSVDQITTKVSACKSHSRECLI